MITAHKGLAQQGKAVCLSRYKSTWRPLKAPKKSTSLEASQVPVELNLLARIAREHYDTRTCTQHFRLCATLPILDHGWR